MRTWKSFCHDYGSWNESLEFILVELQTFWYTEWLALNYSRVIEQSAYKCGLRRVACIASNPS